ncbi:ABC transporter ATP-binding protein [Halomarina salina]|uniref:Molybdate/tungstate import ATP-binding protein WtpC n=1 Tax=Halomarina salina TaxID=1872699 RepID=A0ABD5RMQ9_9EURY
MSLDATVRTTFTAPGAEPFVVDADLTVPDGETLVVLGPSGSGKTLVLETVAGLHENGGNVALDGRDLTGLPPEKRGFGFVFQDYALFPHMTVRENVAFGTRYRDTARDPDDLLDSLGVAHLAERTPRTLSGGEAQRVALARALAVDPQALLLDEPLSALDVPTRESLRRDLAGVLDGVTAAYVTHDRTTARALADRVAVMRDGRVVQTGTVEAVFERPATSFVARFTGANVLPASLVGDGDEQTGGESRSVAVRPEHVRLDGGTLRATVRSVVREDGATRVTLAADGVEFAAYTDDPPRVGASVGVSVPEERRVVLDDA